MPIFDRPQPIDVTKTNRIGRLYVTTDDTQEELPDNVPDGSFRITFTPGDEFPHIELKTSGVWNQTGLMLSPSSIALGFDMKVGAAAGWISTDNPSEFNDTQESLVPHITFTPMTGTGPAVWPFLNRVDSLIIQEPVTTKSATMHTFSWIDFPETRIINNARFRTGPTIPTAEVLVTWYNGPDSFSPRLAQRTLPPSDFSADTNLIIPYDGEFGLQKNGTYFFRMESDIAWDMYYDAPNNLLALALVGFPVEEVGALTENVIIDNDLNFIFADDGITNEPYIVNYFPFVEAA